MAGTAAVIQPWQVNQATAAAPASPVLQSPNGLSGINQGAGTLVAPPAPAAAPAGPSPAQIAAQQQAAANARAQADTIAYLNDQGNQLRSLLGHANTAYGQALTGNEDSYNKGVGTAQVAHDNNVQDQNGQKQSTYDTINRNAGVGYHSLASIIGRAAGTGSSAFGELLPQVVGSDASSQRLNASDTYGQNLSKIDTSLQTTLGDLLAQKKANEDNIRNGFEGKLQDINGQLAQNAGAIAQAQGGGYAQIKASEAPYQTAIDNSRNAVDNFFNTLRTPYTPVAQNPNLAQYTADRAAINAQSADPSADSTNPYAQMLLKKQQGTGATAAPLAPAGAAA